MREIREEQKYMYGYRDEYKNNRYRTKVYNIDDYRPAVQKTYHSIFSKLFYLKDKMSAAIIGLLVIVIICLICNSFIVNASGKTSPITYKYYTDVRINRGDTLWSVASQYISEEYHSIEEYMNEIMELNSMNTREVYYGERIMVPYYSSELK